MCIRDSPNTWWDSNDHFQVSHWIVCKGTTPPEDDPEITVTKDVHISYDVEYLWQVDKQVVPSLNEPGGADVTYKAVVTRTGPFAVEGSYEVSGTITVENTGNVEVTLTGVEDLLSTSGSDCDVLGALPVDLDVDDTLYFDYSCTVPGLPAATDHTNTATADFDFDGEQMSEDSTAMTVDYTAALVGETLDETATLSDDKYPGITPNSYEGSGESDDYTITIPRGGDNCNPGYTNTATITGDDTKNSDSDSVTVVSCDQPEGPTTTGEVTTTTAAPTTSGAPTTSVVPSTGDEVENLPPVIEEAPQSGALPQTGWVGTNLTVLLGLCLLYTSPSPRDRTRSRMPSSA